MIAATKQMKLTSLSMHSSIVLKLRELSKRSGLTCDQLIIYCLQRYADEVQASVDLERLSMYQSPCKEYQAIPIKISQALYEKGFDLRKALKLSLSFIFALAFEAYLEDLQSPQETSSIISYSYKDDYYQGDCFYTNGRHIYVYSWEKPPN